MLIAVHFVQYVLRLTENSLDVAISKSSVLDLLSKAGLSVPITCRSRRKRWRLPLL